jgi:hypothetical protein
MDKTLLFTSVSALAWPRYLLDKRLREPQMHTESECKEEISSAFKFTIRQPFCGLSQYWLSTTVT